MTASSVGKQLLTLGIIGFTLFYGYTACSSEAATAKADLPRVIREPPNTRSAFDHVSAYLPVTPADSDLPLDLTSSATIDEQRFMTHRLYWIGLRVPDLSSSEASAEIDLLATEASKMKLYATSKGMDQEIASSCDAMIAVLNGYQHLLTGRAAAQASEAAIDQENAGKAFLAGAAIGMQAETPEELMLGLAVAAFGQISNQEKQQQAASSAQQARHAEAVRLARRKIVEIDVNVSQLADRHHWAPGSVGRWNDASMTVDANSDSLISRLLGEAKQRPDDPFVVLYCLQELFRVVSMQEPGKLAADDRRFALELIDYGLGRVSCIPAARIFDQDRFDHISACALMLLVTDTSKYVTHGYRDGPTTSGKVLRRVLANCRAMGWSDSDGLDLLTVHSLAATGDLDGAIQSIKAHMESPQHDAWDSVYYAGILAAKGDLEYGMKWLEHGIGSDYHDFKELIDDRDLYLLRKAYPDRWKAATTPQWEWNVVWGMFNDDVTLTNKSPFTLTNVSVKPAIVVNGSMVSPSLVTVAEIKPGTTYTWSNCMSVDKSKVTSSKTTMTCDQSLP